MEHKKYKKCGKKFEVSDDDLEFIRKVSPEYGVNYWNCLLPNFVSLAGGLSILYGVTSGLYIKSNLIKAGRRNCLVGL